MDFHFYHLDSNPFVAHSLDRLFWNAMYQVVWDGLLERIDAHQGIIGVLGQPGLGKSTLLQTYRSSVDPTYVHVIDGIDAMQSKGDLLTSLAQACGLILAGDHPEALFSKIYRHCHAVHTCGRQMVLLIDDAHTLSMTALGNLHELFARLHDKGEPLLQMVLCGSPTLQQRCQHPDLYLFEQALPTSLTLSPLPVDDRAAYIQHYLQSASTQAAQIFTKGALKLIADHTHGIPKIINITCSDVLVAGLLAGEKPISVATVRSVLGDDAVRMPPIVRWGLVSAAGLLLAAGLWTMLPTTLQTSPHAASTAASQALPPPSQPAATPAQTIAALRPARAAVAEPDTPRSLPIATSLEVENTIREFRERQAHKNSAFKTAAIDRRDIDSAQDQADDVKAPRDMASPPMPPAPAATEVAHIDKRSTAIRGAETTAPMVPAALGPAPPKPNTPQPPDRSEALARLDNNRHRHISPEARPSQPTRMSPPLVTSARARLLCAMPRPGGQRGSDIVLLDPTRHSVHRLIDDGSQNMSPVLSPDGTHLAYTSYRDGTSHIYLRDLASGQETQLTSGPWLALPGTWSPNGRYLSFSQNVKGNNDIFIYDMMQQRFRRLTQHKGIDVSPSFAPDSQRLVFSSDRTGSPQLYITDIAGTSPVRLTQTGAYNTSPSWSPRDDTIAFVGRGKHRALDLYTIKSDGTQRQRLTQGQQFHTPPAWSPDGYTLMGMSLHGAVWERRLVQLNPDRAAPSLPNPASLCLAPQWVAYRAP
jgi:type II secretory pathway predicted ATPase ExeA